MRQVRRPKAPRGDDPVPDLPLDLPADAVPSGPAPETRDPEPEILLLAPFGRDAEQLTRVLAQHGFRVRSCCHEGGLTTRLSDATEAVLLTQEALTAATCEALTRFEERQPVWSELPIVLLVEPDFAAVPPWRNVSRMLRPVAVADLVAVMTRAREARARQQQLRRLMTELQQANTRLDKRVRERTRHLGRTTSWLEDERNTRRRAEADLRHAHARLAELRERQRLALARELHDDVVQRLILANMALARELERHPAQPVAELLTQQRQVVLDTIGALRRVIRELRPAGLEYGLGPALQAFVADQAERTDPPVAIRLELELPQEPPPPVALCLFRAAQELLRNCLRHAGDCEIRLCLRQREDSSGSWVTLQVEDDGHGFTPPARLAALAQDDHFGLLGLEEAAAELRGSVTLHSTPGAGTRVTVEIPLEPPG